MDDVPCLGMGDGLEWAGVQCAYGMILGRPGHALEQPEPGLCRPAWQAFERMHDQQVAIPVRHAGQVQPFAGAGKANLLLVDAGLFGKAQWYLAVVEYLQFVGTGLARQLIGDC